MNSATLPGLELAPPPRPPLSDISREYANRLNPLIDSIHARETMRNCAQLVEAIGYDVSQLSDSLLVPILWKLTSMVGAALQYELAAEAR